MKEKSLKGFEARREKRFCCESHWKSESHPEQLRPPGREVKGNGCNVSLPSESHDVTFLVLAIKRDGVKHFAHIVVRLHHNVHAELEN